MFRQSHSPRSPVLVAVGATLNIPYQEAIKHVKEALKAEGFGVLTEIDVHKTLQEKLGTEMEPYILRSQGETMSNFRDDRGTVLATSLVALTEVM